jgi:hypothetical protein
LSNNRGVLTPGTIVIIDLDSFEEVVKERGWSRYSPNPATGMLTRLVENFVAKWQAVVLYGLDEERGTEEVVIEVPMVEPEELLDDLENIKRELNRLGVGVTIVAMRGVVGSARKLERREAYRGSPYRAAASKILRRAKKRGGNVIVVV